MAAALLVMPGPYDSVVARAEALTDGAPPRVFVDKGACSFECCTYRPWTVDADTHLYDRPGGKKVGMVKKGECVTGVTFVRAAVDGEADAGALDVDGGSGSPVARSLPEATHNPP